MAEYHAEMARLSAMIEGSRAELKRCLDHGDDPTEAHTITDELISKRYRLALSEHWGDHDAAAADCDKSQKMARDLVNGVQ